jgi:hypothetical protein
MNQILTFKMSFADLAQKLTEIRRLALQQQAYGNFDSLNINAVQPEPKIDLNKLNTLYDRVSNGQGDLTELYREACKYGVPEQTFMQIEASRKHVASTQIGSVQKAFHKITLRPKKKDN